jgi:hypothetical protein
MTRNGKLIVEHRVGEEHQVKARTDRPADGTRNSVRPTRDGRRHPGRTVRSRDGHSEVKAPRHDGHRELRVPRHSEVKAPSAVPRSEAPQELTQPAGRASTNAWSDAAPVLFLILAFANMVAFYSALIVGF